jgi:hypothetical protein
LIRFAERTGDAAVPAIIDRLTAPVTVAVRGRAGVGRRTVAGALSAAGVPVTADAADVTVLVTAETLKPEDRAVLAGLDGPALVVLNKADRTGWGGAGPIDQARRRAGELQTLTGVPTVPLVGLLAAVRLDAGLTTALQVLARETSDIRTFSSTDAFLTGGHPPAAETRARLLRTLDRFGIACAVLALSGGADPAALPGVLRRVSGLDEVLHRLHTVAAPVRYRRIRAAVADLQAAAVRRDDTRLARLLTGDAVVLATMRAAEEVMRAAGLATPDGADRAARLRRAVHWHRYSRGPVGPLHRACARDICRGSLRLAGARAGVGSPDS